EFRPRCQRSGDFGAPPVRIGEREGGIVQPGPEPLTEEVDGRTDFGLSHSLGADGGRPEGDGSEHSAAGPVMSAEQDVFADRQLGEHPDALEGAGNPVMGDAVSGPADQLTSKQPHGSRRPSHDAGDQVADAGLAGSVRAAQADDLSLVDVALAAVYRCQPAAAPAPAPDV